MFPVNTIEIQKIKNPYPVLQAKLLQHIIYIIPLV